MSSNDQAVVESWIFEEKARLEQDRIRKAEERRKARRPGDVDRADSFTLIKPAQAIFHQGPVFNLAAFGNEDQWPAD